VSRETALRQSAARSEFEIELAQQLMFAYRSVFCD
jgi:hypothetical protein